jgi:hypothetical protein
MRIEILPLGNRQREEHAYSAVPMRYVRSYLLYVLYVQLHMYLGRAL